MSRLPILCLFFVLGACRPSAAKEPELSRPRNMILLVVDGLRADHVGAYGYARPTTPNIDRLAQRGVVYERAYAASSAGQQSLAALWTGRLPTSGGAIGMREAMPHKELVTLPRGFLRRGFRTALVSNRMGLRERAFTRGFDRIEVDSTAGRWTGEQVTRKALELAEGFGQESFLLVAQYSDASEPYFPPQAFREAMGVPYPEQMLSLPDLRGAAGDLPPGIERSPGFQDLVARYDGEIAYVDACIGALLQELEGRGLLQDTLVCVTSNHGTEFLEHGYVGHGWTLYDEVLRVPLVFYAGGFLPAARIEAPVSTVDLVPTLAGCFDLDFGGSPLDGQSLFAAGPGEARMSTPRGAVVAELVIPELSILRASMRQGAKAIEAIAWTEPAERLELMSSYGQRIDQMAKGEIPRPDLWGTPVRREFFDLERDPRELSEVSAREEERFERIASSLERYAEFCRAQGLAARSAELPMETPGAEELDELEQLQQIGYL